MFTEISKVFVKGCGCDSDTDSNRSEVTEVTSGSLLQQAQTYIQNKNYAGGYFLL